MAAVSRGTSRLSTTQRCQYTTWVDIQKRAIKAAVTHSESREPVWPSGRQRDLRSNLLRLSFHFKRCGLRTLLGLCPSQMNIKMALIAAHLNAELILVVTV